LSWPTSKKGHGEDFPAAGAGDTHAEDSQGVETVHSGQVVLPTLSLFKDVALLRVVDVKLG